MRRAVSAAVVAALAGCSSGPAARRSELVNGSLSSDTAVVAVIHTRPDGSRQLCSGTIVAPTVILTAKHCVYEDLGGSEWTANPPSSMSILLGDDVMAPRAEIAVAAISTTPGPYRDGDGAIGGDLALLTLEAPTGLTPAQVTLDPPVDGMVRIVGFGYSGAGATGTLGRRAEGAADIVSVAAGTFTSEGSAWTCTGDSGGPAFRWADGLLLGVTSIGPRGCPASTSIYTRLDVHRDLLVAAGVPIEETDAGVAADAGADDASTAGIDGGAAPTSGGCACRLGRSRAPAPLALVLAAVLVRRRRSG